MIKLNARGETIVEVLIAIAVVSSVLAGAFAISNRSLQGSRQSQERVAALKHAENQLERLEAAVKAPSPLPAKFCFRSDNTVEPVSNSLPTADINDPNALNGYPSACKNNFYHYVIAEDTTLPNVYRIIVRWDRAGGGRDEAVLRYKVHP